MPRRAGSTQRVWLAVLLSSACGNSTSTILVDAGGEGPTDGEHLGERPDSGTDVGAADAGSDLPPGQVLFFFTGRVKDVQIQGEHPGSLPSIGAKVTGTVSYNLGTAGTDTLRGKRYDDPTSPSGLRATIGALAVEGKPGAEPFSIYVVGGGGGEQTIFAESNGWIAPDGPEFEQLELFFERSMQMGTAVNAALPTAPLLIEQWPRHELIVAAWRNPAPPLVSPWKILCDLETFSVSPP